ncbi:cation diffusion facilitator family transporter [Sanyastnella coralliicola]|uniref:cation diffusion facilitator family transporter n=1 Tax=Sanyastnella coralliicola TaxID=3069118 RepID=UPI0027BAE711|nr:cation diffusion facilitator family transporter [Longitalea sp. SCSIO 12813]
MHQIHTRNIRIAFWLNLVFFGVELFGGWYTNSLAILSDALHDFGDSLSLGLAWYFQSLARKGRDEKFTYGYRRYSLLGALINSLILTAGSIFIVVEAIPRIREPQETLSTGMFAIAVVGIIINYLAMKQLRQGNTLNERVVSLHLLEDVLGWVAILIGAVIIYFTGWHVIDPILSVLIAGFILFNVIRNVRESLNIILQKVPESISVPELSSTIKDVGHILEVRDLHLWTLDGEKMIMSVVLVVEEGVSRSALAKIKKEVRHAVRAFNIEHATIEIVLPGEDDSHEKDR